MSTATTTEIYYCTDPLQWPDPSLTAPNYKGRHGGWCFEEFATKEERSAHQLVAHAAYRSELAAPRPVRSTAPTTEVVDWNEPEPEPSSSTPYSGPVASSEATEKQLAYIAALADRKGVEANEVRTKTEANIEIDRLNSLADKEPFRRNMYAGNCTDCGLRVEANEGMVRKVAGKWLTGHIDGCPTKPEVVEADVVPDGYYAVSAEAGHTSFYKVTAGRNPGVIFVDLLTGGGTNGSFQNQKVPYGNIETVLNKIRAAGFEEAAKRFGQESGRCSRCNRGLTDEVSRERGLGPECYRKS